MHIQTDRALMPAATPSVRYLQVLVSAPPAPASGSAAASRPPVHVALVLDRSGSMDGSKITMARRAVTHAVRLLKPADHLAVVCYDDEIDTVLERTSASPEAKALVVGRLAGIEPRGSTNLSGGWLAGAQQLQPADASGAGVKRVLLLTDGLANAGEVDPQALAATAARLRAEGITTSTFGIGADFDEALLARLATQGGGHFYYIETARQIPDVFASELGETLDVVARDAVFEVACRPGTRVTLLNDLPVEQGAGGLRVRLGDLVADHEVTLMLAVSVEAPVPLGSGIEVRCRLSDRDQVLCAEPMHVDWPAVSAADNDAQPVNQAVVLAVATMQAERARGQALAANRRGAYDEALGILREAVRELRPLGADNAAVEALMAQLQHEQADVAEAMSPADRKQRHFRAYSISNGSRDFLGKAKRKAKAS